MVQSLRENRRAVSHHMNSKEEVKLKFHQFLDNQISINEFESWIYITPALESYLGNDHYIDLISYNFKNKYVKNDIDDLIRKFVDIHQFEIWRTINLLSQIDAHKVEIVLASRNLRKLYKSQEISIEQPLISIGLGIGFESELDSCPIESEYHQWNKEQLKEQLEPVEWYKKDFLKTVKKELDTLLKKKKDDSQGVK